MFQTKARCLFICWICLKNIFLKWCKTWHFVIRTDVGQKCHFNPLNDFFFSFLWGGRFFSQHCSALFRAAVICTVSFDTDGYFKPLRWGEGEKGICCQSQRQCSSISHRLFAKSLHFKWAWNVKVGFLMLGPCLGMERENRGKMIMLVC